MELTIKFTPRYDYIFCHIDVAIFVLEVTLNIG